MTILLGRRTDREPILCMVCGRRASGFGYTPSATKKIGWLCNDPDCYPLAQGVYAMSAQKLDAFEAKAVEAAGTSSLPGFVEALLGALWSQGVRNLDELDAGTLEKIVASLQAAPEYRRSLESFLYGYADSLRSQITTNQAPF